MRRLLSCGCYHSPGKHTCNLQFSRNSGCYVLQARHITQKTLWDTPGAAVVAAEAYTAAVGASPLVNAVFHAAAAHRHSAIAPPFLVTEVAVPDSHLQHRLRCCSDLALRICHCRFTVPAHFPAIQLWLLNGLNQNDS